MQSAVKATVARQAVSGATATRDLLSSRTLPSIVLPPHSLYPRTLSSSLRPIYYCGRLLYQLQTVKPAPALLPPRTPPLPPVLK